VSKPSVVCDACGIAACRDDRFVCALAREAGTRICRHRSATDQERGWVCDDCGADMESD